jgi:hypothetical protein
MITIVTMPRIAVVLLSCLLLFGCVTKLVDRMTGEDKADEIRATGQPARARVLKVWSTGTIVNGNPVIGLRLKVYGYGEPFETDTKALINRRDVSRFRAGIEISVMYDPEDHSRVALDIYDSRK